jgi:hypothetical protein
VFQLFHTPCKDSGYRGVPESVVVQRRKLKKSGLPRHNGLQVLQHTKRDCFGVAEITLDTSLLGFKTQTEYDDSTLF